MIWGLYHRTGDSYPWSHIGDADGRALDGGADEVIAAAGYERWDGLDGLGSRWCGRDHYPHPEVLDFFACSRHSVVWRVGDGEYVAARPRFGAES